MKNTDKGRPYNWPSFFSFVLLKYSYSFLLKYWYGVKAIPILTKLNNLEDCVMVNNVFELMLLVANAALDSHNLPVLVMIFVVVMYWIYQHGPVQLEKEKHKSARSNPKNGKEKDSEPQNTESNHTKH